LARNLKKVGLKSIALTGGEPLLRKDIAEVVSIFKRHGFNTRLQTNGFLLEESLLKKLLVAGVDDIFISFDALHYESFLIINGLQNKSYFEKVLNNIKAASRLTRPFGCGLVLTTILQPANVTEVEDLYAFAVENRVLIGFYPMEIGQSTDENNIRAYDPELAVNEHQRQQLKDAFLKVKSLMAKSGSPIVNSEKTVDDSIRHCSQANSSMKWACNAGTYYLEVLPDGKICICNATPAIPGYTYKNIGKLYKHSGRDAIFQRLRKSCSGCICTRQFEYLMDDKCYLLKKVLQFFRFF